MVNIRWTNEAEQWLKDIYDYVSRDNPDAANRVTMAIYEKTQVLTEFPEIGYIHKSVEEGAIRVLFYGHYRIAYLLKNENNIDILGVFHGAMDMDRYLPKAENGMEDV